jgi:sugar-phosphatase
MTGRKEEDNSHIRKLNAQFLFFDLDGTLVDSGKAIAESWHKLVDAYGLDGRKLPAALGGRAIDTIRKLVDEGSVPEVAEAFTAFELETASSVREVLGAGTLLGPLPRNIWGLVTSSSMTVALAKMKSAKLPIPDLIISGDDYNESKPSAAPYLVALRRANHIASECICFENSTIGITSAQQCELRVVGVTTDIPDCAPGTVFTIPDWTHLHIELVGNGGLEVSYLGTL